MNTRSALGLMIALACSSESRDRVDGGALPALVTLPDTPACTGDSLRPTTAAPAEGLWVFEATSGDSRAKRVAAMIGPAQVKAESRLTRRIETMESVPGGNPIRHHINAAEVRLELLPPPGGADTLVDSTSTPRQPVAVYAVTPLILLASYEPCAVSKAAPRLRYLRRDAQGRYVTDVMLRR